MHHTHTLKHTTYTHMHTHSNTPHTTHSNTPPSSTTHRIQPALQTLDFRRPCQQRVVGIECIRQRPKVHDGPCDARDVTHTSILREPRNHKLSATRVYIPVCRDIFPSREHVCPRVAATYLSPDTDTPLFRVLMQSHHPITLRQRIL